MKRRLLRLLENWVEREIIRTLGRALIIPEVTHRWGRNKIGGFEILSSGICWEKCTAPRANCRLDDFGVAFRELDEIEQGLIITDHLGDGVEWGELIRFYGISNKNAERLLRIGWSRLTLLCILRELV